MAERKRGRAHERRRAIVERRSRFTWFVSVAYDRFNTGDWELVEERSYITRFGARRRAAARLRGGWPVFRLEREEYLVAQEFSFADTPVLRPTVESRLLSD